MTLPWYYQSASKYQAQFDLWQKLSMQRQQTMTEPTDQVQVPGISVGTKWLTYSIAACTELITIVSVISDMCTVCWQIRAMYRQFLSRLSALALANKLNRSAVVQSLLQFATHNLLQLLTWLLLQTLIFGCLHRFSNVILHQILMLIVSSHSTTHLVM